MEDLTSIVCSQWEWMHIFVGSMTLVVMVASKDRVGAAYGILTDCKTSKPFLTLICYVCK